MNKIYTGQPSETNRRYWTYKKSPFKSNKYQRFYSKYKNKDHKKRALDKYYKNNLFFLYPVHKSIDVICFIVYRLLVIVLSLSKQLIIVRLHVFNSRQYYQTVYIIVLIMCISVIIDKLRPITKQYLVYYRPRRRSVIMSRREPAPEKNNYMFITTLDKRSKS